MERYYKVPESLLRFLIQDAIYYHLMIMDFDLDSIYEKEITNLLLNYNVRDILELAQLEIETNPNYELIKKGA